MKMLPENGYDARKVERIASIFRWLLYSKFRDNREEAIEILLMLVVGHVFGYYTPNQLAQRLDIPKSQLYEELKFWSIYQWRRQLMVMGSELAVEFLQ